MRRPLLTAYFILSGLLPIAGWMTGCQKPTAQTANPAVDYYTCAMHPSVHLQDPHAKCPICSMDLVPVLKKGAVTLEAISGRELAEFNVPVARQQQIGVTFATVTQKSLRSTLRAVGFVAPDRTREWDFAARVEGYIQKLDVTSPGQSVEPGQPLLTIYSPELATAERELMNLLDTRDRATADAKAAAQRSVEAAQRRLEQWNITSKQVTELEASRQPSEILSLVSPFKGVVEEVPVGQGSKVRAGDRLVEIVDLSVVWVWAEFYEDELPLLALGQKIRLTAKPYPGQTFEGTVALIDPFLAELKRTVKVRIDVPNSELKLRPAMYMDISLAVEGGEKLAIPTSAAMPTGERTLVFVDHGGGKLEPRRIQLGRRFGDDYEVLGGLRQGERVVNSANFLIDAESKVQGAVKAFEEPLSDKAGAEKGTPTRGPAAAPAQSSNEEH